MANVGYASPVSFAGDQKNLGGSLERFRQNLEAHLNSFVPSYNKDDADLYVNDGVVASATFTPTLSNHLVTKSYADTLAGNYLPLAGGTMTGAIALPDGSSSAPALTFSADSDMGIYRSSADSFGLSLGSNDVMFFEKAAGTLGHGLIIRTSDNPSGTESLLEVRASGGAVHFITTFGGSVQASNDFAFVNDTDTKFVNSAADQIRVDVGGYFAGQWGGASADWNGWFKVPDGTLSLPGVMFGNDTNTGFYRSSADQITLVVGGAEGMLVNTTIFRSVNIYNSTDGSNNPNVFVNSAGRLYRTTGGIDADTVDTLHASSFLRSDANDTFTGTTLSMSGNLSFSSSTYGVVNFWPTSDDLYDCGSAARRFDDVYATNGTIITSDPSTKSNVRAGTPGLQLLRRVQPITFNRDNGVRDHAGFDADEVKAALDELGIDLGAFVDPSLNPKKLDSGEELIGPKGLRVDELVAVLWDAVKEIDDELARTIRREGTGGSGATPPGQ